MPAILETPAPAESRESLFYEPLTIEDQLWLEAMGCHMPDEGVRDIWLIGMNTLVAEGSAQLGRSNDENLQRTTLKAREQFLDTLTAIGQDARETFKDNNPWAIPLDTIVATQRLLYRSGVNAAKAVNGFPNILGYAPESVEDKLANLAKYGIDPAEAVNGFPTVLGYAPKSVEDKLDNLVARDIDISKVVNVFPAVLGYAPESVEDKLDNLANHGIDVAKAINRFPNILAYAPESVEAKIANLESHGLDPAKAVDRFPVILGYAPETVSRKILILKGAARAWGIEDPASVVSVLTEQIPSLLSNKAAKLKTLIRIASYALPRQPRTPIQAGNVLSITINNLEATLAGYLEEGEDIQTPADIKDTGRKYNALGKKALLAIIADHPDDPAVKVYYRGYPASKAA